MVGAFTMLGRIIYNILPEGDTATGRRFFLAMPI